MIDSHVWSGKFLASTAVRCGVCILLGTLFGCVDDGRINLQYCEDSSPYRTVDSTATPRTWHQDVAPIVAQSCTGCHASDLAPFPLAHPEDFVERIDLVEFSLLAGRMPPWSAAGACCGKTYRADRSLSQDELDILVAWLRPGAARVTG